MVEAIQSFNVREGRSGRASNRPNFGEKVREVREVREPYVPICGSGMVWQFRGDDPEATVLVVFNHMIISHDGHGHFLRFSPHKVTVWCSRWPISIEGL